MKKIILFVVLLFSTLVFSQNEQLAQYYFDKGDYEKAKLGYENLLKLNPMNSDFSNRLIVCYQQLKQYDLVEKILTEKYNLTKQGAVLIDLGYNLQLQRKDEKAKKYYEQAIDKIKKNPNEVYEIAFVFEKKILTDYALKAYQAGITVNPNFNFNYQMALLYGQLGNTDMMISLLLEESQVNPKNLYNIQNQFSRFIAEEGSSVFTDALRKALIAKVQKDQSVFWSKYLSWFYIQQKEFGKAFTQEKAIYKREPDTSLSTILNLAQLSIEEKDDETAKEILNFIIENSKNNNLTIQAYLYLIKIKIAKTVPKDYVAVDDEITELLKKFGTNEITLQLQLLQAHFRAFNMKRTEEGKNTVKTALNLPLNTYQNAQCKMELADILLCQEKFNQALLYYSQIELDLKNDALAHEASLKAAKTSYFKTDFDWALKQFKELKAASTQLIANDALEYFLLINDNTVADSTQTALKAFAHADFLYYQNRNDEALKKFQDILKDFKGNEIEAVTLLRLGNIYEKINDFSLALNQYQEIITNYKTGIYVDEALFFLGEIYNNQLKDFEKAKLFYEKIILNHQDSIYYVEARRKYRLIRGDKNL